MRRRRPIVSLAGPTNNMRNEDLQLRDPRNTRCTPKPQRSLAPSIHPWRQRIYALSDASCRASAYRILRPIASIRNELVYPAEACVACSRVTLLRAAPLPPPTSKLSADAAGDRAMLSLTVRRGLSIPQPEACSTMKAMHLLPLEPGPPCLIRTAVSPRAWQPTATRRTM